MLHLKRKWFLDNRTIGELYIVQHDGSLVHECYTLEDKCRDDDITHEPFKLIRGETAIPAGEYLVVCDYSPKFKRLMPHLLRNTDGEDGLPTPDGQEYRGVRIHPGTNELDTEGCILVGASRGISQVYYSIAAFTQLFKKLTENGPTMLLITNEPDHNWVKPPNIVPPTRKQAPEKQDEIVEIDGSMP